MNFSPSSWKSVPEVVTNCADTESAQKLKREANVVESFIVRDTRARLIPRESKVRSYTREDYQMIIAREIVVTKTCWGWNMFSRECEKEASKE